MIRFILMLVCLIPVYAAADVPFFSWRNLVMIFGISFYGYLCGLESF